jgi:hypothetical protein
MRVSFFGLMLLLAVTIAMSLALHVILMRPVGAGQMEQAARPQGQSVEPALAVGQPAAR